MSSASDSARSERTPRRLWRVRRTGKILGVTAVLGLAAAGISYASIPDSGGVIHGCYNTTSYALRVIDTAKRTTCPSGTTSLNWNQTGPQGPAGPQGAKGASGSRGAIGPQGPAGVSTGISASSNTGVALNTGVNNFVPVLTTAAAPVAGTYYISADLMTYVGQGDGVDCILGTSTGGFPGLFADVDPVAVSSFQTLPLNEAIPLAAGETVQVYCGDYTGNGATAFYDGGITGTLINSATGNAAAAGLTMTTRHPLSPRP